MKVYDMKSTLFQELRALRKLAKIVRHKYYKESRVLLLKNIYVNNFLFGTDTLEELLEIIRQIITILSTAGMSLGKWAANDVTASPVCSQQAPVTLFK